jgi:hypothetical protein
MIAILVDPCLLFALAQLFVTPIEPPFSYTPDLRGLSIEERRAFLEGVQPADHFEGRIPTSEETHLIP